MAADIIPIELGLTAGNVLTLWAPTWREDGEDWEAFLGHGDSLYVFPTTAALAAFIRTSDEHDLLDHPEWEAAGELLVDELAPDDDHSFDIVGVPDLVAEPADIWTLAELTDTVAILRSLAEVCGLDTVDRGAGFRGRVQPAVRRPAAFSGRNGEKLWNEIGAVVAERWDEVVDALDAIVATPEVDAQALEMAQAEAAAISAAEKGPEGVPAAGEEPRRRGPRTRTWSSGTRPASTAWKSPSANASATPCGATSARTRCSSPRAAAFRSTPHRRTWRTT